MKIIVNDIAASSGGALTILKSFYKFICESEEAKKHIWIFLLSDNYISETSNIKVIVRSDIKKSWINRLKFDFVEGKQLIDDLNPDLVFSMQNTAIYGLNYPQVIYLHQSIPFQKIKKFSFLKYDEFKLAIYQYVIGYIIKSSLKKAHHIIVQTKWMKSAIIEQLKINKTKITNILPPIDLVDKSLYKDQFCNNSFFYPADNFSYKNHYCLLEAVRLLNNLGISDFELKLTINDNESHSNIKYLGTIPHETVLKEYNRSVLVFPSYIETIGLPLLEARQFGTLILASDTPFSREALDNYPNAYFFNPFNPNELVELMNKVMKGSIKKLDSSNINFDNNSWEDVLKLLESEGI